MGSQSLTVIGPFMAIMVVGYFIGRLRVLPAESSGVLSQFVFAVALPALIFPGVAKTAVGDFFDWTFIGALGGGMLLVMGASVLTARRLFPDTLTANGLHGLAAMFSSTAYIGLPLVLTLFGDEALAPGIIGAVITGLVFVPIAIVLAEVGSNRRTTGALLKPLAITLTRPPLIAAFAGLVVSAAGITIPTPIITFCDVLGGAFVPCALFAAGLFTAQCTFDGIRLEVGWLVLVKLILHPAITWMLAVCVFALPPLLVAVAVVQAALPTGVPVFVLAQQYGTFVTRSSAIIAVSTGLSVVTLPIWAWLLTSE